jgi:hypothetical protein
VKHLYLSLITLLLLVSCKPAPDNHEENPEVRQQVRATRLYTGPFSDFTELNAASHYLKEHLVNSPVAGYITKAQCVTGNLCKTDEILFEVKTREAKALGQAGNEIQSNLKIGGTITITADISGFISQVFHQAGDFVAEGESLASIRETGSLVFILDLPYEWNSKVKMNMSVNVELPDGNVLKGIISNISPMADAVSQTQKVYISIHTSVLIPEGLTATVLLPVETHMNTQVVPRSAVLTNETESEFWVMKLINDSTAVKIMILPGIQYHDSLEIASPRFLPGDEFLVTGNYAVPDTIMVNVIH